MDLLRRLRRPRPRPAAAPPAPAASPSPANPAAPTPAAPTWRAQYVGTVPGRKVVASPGFDVRLNHYLGFLATLDGATFRVCGTGPALIGRLGMDRDAFEALAARYEAGRRYLGADAHPNWHRRRYRTYVQPITEGLAGLGERRPFLVIVGDNTRSAAIPAFAKSRLAEPAGFTILLPLNRQWHFGRIGEVAAHDIPFAHKEPRLVWRGKTTGVFVDRPGTAERGARAHILARAAAERADMDLGYSGLTPPIENHADTALTAAVRAAVKGELSMAEQLACRYLLALEGHDVASGLKWMLASNSLVLMPRPRIDSWACESLMQPFVHYVPVRPDLADLDDALAWCRANDAACRRIVANAQAFVAPFGDDAAERDLAHAVAERVLARATFTAGEGLPAGILD